ncbi:MTMRE-like protein [Mya arenaria]|uniref:MTMRE-like protein n=1 Tax=Mya arenaria TaxID=6604 RepID=A0ABY7FXL3_MYAAR|nr:MTMRE-like protein [Mya arenaria]
MSESCYEDIKHEEIHRLIESFSKTSYKVKADRKHVCRSATLSSGAEMYRNEQTSQKLKPAASDSDLQMFDRVRGQDINILKTFNVKYIVDLMVEKKKVKFGMNITSSEKVDKENRYGEFCIASVPYPGCEFFREWRDNAYVGEAMKFDWSQSFVDACLDIPPTELLTQLHIDWHQYKTQPIGQIDARGGDRFSKDLKKHLTPVSSSGSLRGLDERRRRNSSTSSGGSTGSFTLEPNSHFYLNCEDEDGSNRFPIGWCPFTTWDPGCEEAIEDPALPERSERWKRLDMVARIFNNAYHHKVTSKLQPDPGNGITNLLDSFAGKLGFKQK